MSLSFKSEEVLVLCGLALSVCLVLVTIVQPWIDPRWLYMDTQTVGELSGDCCHIYDGAVSTLGIMLWSATAAICLFAAVLCIAADQKRAALLSLHGSLLSAFLALDDAYLLHEIVAPKIGIPQIVFMALIGVAALSYLILHARFLRQSGAWILAISLICFAISVGIDQIFHSIHPLWIIAEDGPKFIGIAAWFLFHLWTHTKLILRSIRPISA